MIKIVFWLRFKVANAVTKNKHHGGILRTEEKFSGALTLWETDKVAHLLAGHDVITMWGFFLPSCMNLKLTIAEKKKKILCYTKRVSESISSQLAVLCRHPDGQSVFFYCIQLSVIRPFIWKLWPRCSRSTLITLHLPAEPHTHTLVEADESDEWFTADTVRR